MVGMRNGGTWEIRRFAVITAHVPSLHSGFLVSIGLRGVGAIAALNINVWLARLLGVVEYGRYMALLSLVLVLGGVAVRGVDQLFTRELATVSAGDAIYTRTLFRWGAKRVFISVIFASVAFVVWVVTTGQVVSPSQAIPVIPAGIALLSLFSVSLLLSGGINGFGASIRSQSLALVFQNGAMLLLIGLVVLVSGPKLTASAALWLQVVAYGVVSVVGLVWLEGLGKHRVGADAGEPARDFVQDKESWRVSSKHFMFMTIAALLVSRLDVVLISTLGGVASAGIYAVGARLAQVALMVPLAVNVVLSPKIASAWSRGEQKVVRTLVRKAFAFTFPLAVFEVFIALFFGSHLVALFGPQYFQATAPFIWVTLAYALWTVAAPGYALMAMSGSERLVAILSWAILVTNVIAILVLVPRHGAIGGAMAMTVGYGLTLPVLIVVVHKKLKGCLSGL